MKKTWRLLLADDHDIVLAGLRLVLNSPEFEIAGCVPDGIALVKAADELRPDVIVADITMPLLNGIDAARCIRQLDSRVRFIFLTMHSDVGYATAALSLGGSGYVLKNMVADELAVAIHEVLAGGVYVSRTMRQQVMQALDAPIPPRASASDTLTSRQREVLQLLAEGLTVKQTAHKLHVSPKTVEFHKQRIREQLGLQTIAELARFAAKNGLVA